MRSKRQDRILLTGADGFLGNNLTRELLKRGYYVRAFIQPGRNSDLLKDLDVDKHEGDLLNPTDLEHAIQSCDYLIHAAASTSLWPDRSEIVRKVNIDGTRNAIQAAIGSSIRKMIYVGTANSFGFGSKKEPGTERNSYTAGKYHLDYTDSKYEAHQLVLEAVHKHNLPAVIVNPTFMFGPYDSKPGTGQMIQAIYKQKVPGYTRGGRNYVCVKDVAIGIANALDKGMVGESYILGNQNLSYKEAFELIATIIDKRPPGIAIPCWTSVIFGAIGSFGGKIFGKQPRVSYPMALMSCDEHYFSAEKARNLLDLPQTSIEVGIKDSYDWLKSNGYLNE